MAFDDVLARDPKSEEEFWEIIEETFVQVEGALPTIQRRRERKRSTARCAVANSKIQLRSPFRSW